MKHNIHQHMPDRVKLASKGAAVGAGLGSIFGSKGAAIGGALGGYLGTKKYNFKKNRSQRTEDAEIAE